MSTASKTKLQAHLKSANTINFAGTQKSGDAVILQKMGSLPWPSSPPAAKPCRSQMDGPISFFVLAAMELLCFIAQEGLTLPFFFQS